MELQVWEPNVRGRSEMGDWRTVRRGNAASVNKMIADIGGREPHAVMRVYDDRGYKYYIGVKKVDKSTDDLLQAHAPTDARWDTGRVVGLDADRNVRVDWNEGGYVFREAATFLSRAASQYFKWALRDRTTGDIEFFVGKRAYSADDMRGIYDAAADREAREAVYIIPPGEYIALNVPSLRGATQAVDTAKLARFVAQLADDFDKVAAATGRDNLKPALHDAITHLRHAVDALTPKATN